MMESQNKDWLIKLGLDAGYLWSYATKKGFKENTLSISTDGDFLIIGTESPYYLLKISTVTGEI